MTVLNAAVEILRRGRAPDIAGRTALVCGDERVTYGELVGLVKRAANAFATAGIGRGDRVALLMDDSPLYVAALLGLMLNGAVAIPLNPKLKRDDYAFVLADAQTALFVLSDDYRDVVGDLGGATVLAATSGADSFASLVARASDSVEPAPTAADDEAFWLFSSGTTGRPKGIVHSHRNAAHASKILREVLALDHRAVVLASSKLFFALALDNALFGPLSLGATAVIQPGVPDPETVARQVAALRPAVLFTVPTFYRRLLALDEQALRPFAALAYPMAGGERIPDDLARRWRAAVGTDLLAIYGASETFCNVFATFPGEVRPGSVGKALDGVACRLVDRDTAAPAGEGGGLLWVKHPSLALRYSSDVATAKAFRDGWFCTNDLFTVDADGYWFYQGRTDELLKVAGQWVKPTEVEDAVVGAPIEEAACVVVADPDGFERLALFVVSADADSAASIAAERAASGLPRHAQPRWIRTVDALPRTSTGKVQRFALRERLLEEWRRPDAGKDLPQNP
ncbi:MAG: AMP-binding protein [Betaproteobacteria bacterium]|nr:AMP-binding protein [Betaproteobacteria bacterium]